MCSWASFWIFLSYWWRKLNAACAVRVLCELLPWRPRTASKCLSEEGVRGAKQICPVGGANDFSTVVFLHMIGERKKWDGERGEGKKKEKFQCWQQNISGSLMSCCSFNIGVCHLNLKKRKPFQNALSYLLSRKKSTSPPSPSPNIIVIFLLILCGIVWVRKLLNIDWFPALPLLSVYPWRVPQRSCWQALNNLPWQRGGKSTV